MLSTRTVTLLKLIISILLLFFIIIFDVFGCYVILAYICSGYILS